jgi:poly(3-hydroxybutyrate) depolymerase
MASVMLATYPEVFAAGGIIAGLPYGSASTIPEAFDRMRGHGGPAERDLQQLLRNGSGHSGPWPKISIWQGAADHIVASSNAEAIAAQWRGVHQLEKAPTRSEFSGAHAKRIWCNAAGEPVIELNTVTAMGHGVPLGNDGLGAPGPYMLDVGISSTREIAQFWGIAQARERASATSRNNRPTSHAPDDMPSAATTARAPDVVAGSPTSTPETFGVRKTIENALRAAGLMR